MRPKSTIQLLGMRPIINAPRERDERTVVAANDAATALLDSTIIDAWDSELTLRQFAARHGYEAEIYAAARSAFLALVGEGIGYREYRALKVYAPSEISAHCQMAMTHYFGWFESKAELRGLAMGTGELLMLQMNPRIERHIEVLSKPRLRSA